VALRAPNGPLLSSTLPPVADVSACQSTRGRARASRSSASHVRARSRTKRNIKIVDTYLKLQYGWRSAWQSDDVRLYSSAMARWHSDDATTFRCGAHVRERDFPEPSRQVAQERLRGGFSCPDPTIEELPAALDADFSIDDVFDVDPLAATVFLLPVAPTTVVVVR